jgi:hypothetical protein
MARKRCKFIKPNGEQCGGYAHGNSEYCIWHDARLAVTRKLWSSRGGRHTQSANKPQAASGGTRSNVAVQKHSRRPDTPVRVLKSFRFDSGDTRLYLQYLRGMPGSYDEIDKWGQMGLAPPPWGWSGTYPPQNEAEEQRAQQLILQNIEAGNLPMSYWMDEDVDGIYDAEVQECIWKKDYRDWSWKRLLKRLWK